MRTLLLNPDHSNPRNNFPWGVLSVASYLKNERGKDVQLLDASLDGVEATLEILRNILPEISLVGIGGMSSDAPFIKLVADFVKTEKPSCKIIVGGSHATLCSEQLANYHNIDFVAYADGEDTLAKLTDELENNEPDINMVPGLIFLENGKIKRTASPEKVPFYKIDYNLLDKRVQDTFGEYIQVLSGRGCSYKCTFCYVSIVGKKWRSPPFELFKAEIDSVVKTYNPSRIYFRDELFFFDKERIRAFIEFYKERKFNFEWRATCRTTDFRDNYVNDELIKELEEIGCECLKFGFESGSDTTLKLIRKGARVEHSKRVVEQLSKSKKIKINASFLVGLPGETYENICETITLAGLVKQRCPNAEIIGPSYYRVYPGGELYEMVVNEYGFIMPSTLEEWVERYSVAENTHGFIDSGIRYEWVPRSAHFLAQNAAFFLNLSALSEWKFVDSYKLKLLRPFQSLVRARLRYGWYRLPLDLHIAKAIYDFDLWGTLENSKLYSTLQTMGWYKRLKQTPAFVAFRGFFSN